MKSHVGRQWTVRELRRKSFDDLHKLWWVLYKEKNMLLTEKYLCERGNLKFPQPFRYIKVKRSMKAIRVVLNERKRERNAEKALLREQAAAEAEAMDIEQKVA
jgi:large subunit ribosomal protein L47